MGKSGFFFFLRGNQKRPHRGVAILQKGASQSLSALMKAPGNGKHTHRRAHTNGRMAEKNTGEFGLSIIVYSWWYNYYNNISQIHKKSVTSQSLARLQENKAKIISF